jgi:pimeloyl-ACP methyl ester carboxylesterase
MNFVTSAGVRLHYVDQGAGEPSFVFLPGWCCDHTFFQPQFDHFRSTHRAIAMDLRGCGESDRPPDGYDIPTQADDVATLCLHLGVEKPVIVGHSLGGMIGVELAARHPSLPRAIVAVDPGPLAMLPESRAVFEAFIAALEGPDSAAARRAYIDGMFLPSDDIERRRWITETMCSVPLEFALPVLRGVVEWNGVRALTLDEAPLLVLLSETGGSNDPARLLALRSTNINFGVTVGAGHFIQLEVPDQVTPMIDRFVRTLA